MMITDSILITLEYAETHAFLNEKTKKEIKNIFRWRSSKFKRQMHFREIRYFGNLSSFIIKSRQSLQVTLNQDHFWTLIRKDTIGNN